ncbi:MAG TPA: hypothetical protein VHU83_15805 [Bryobacteraceae bacterium]|jgi:hypothetical protein|nr:hypothetical protein [Bryobacteraceae bacterium]
MKEFTEKTANKSGRVLARRGARELTVREAEAVSGGGSLTCTDVASLARSTATATGCGDNDGGHDTDIGF